MLTQMEIMVQQIRQNLKASQERKKSYLDRKRSTKEYSVGEHVFLRAKEKKSTLRTWICTKITKIYGTI